MANGTTVNPQIVDAVTSVDLNVVGASPAMAMGMLFQMGADAVGLAMQNATAIQGGMAQVTVALVSTSCAMIVAQGPK